MPSKALPFEITSYDLLKTFAVIVMVIDHLGYYFFYDEPWWRAVGRTGFPVWFFLVGYATGRDIPARLMVSAIILLAASPAVGLSLFPLNALFTIMTIRIVLDPLMQYSMQSRVRLWLVLAGLAAIAMPSCALTEYGTLGLLTAMAGYVMRHRQSIRDGAMVSGVMAFSLLCYVTYEQLNYEFQPAQFAFVALSTAAVWAVLFKFRARSYPGLTAGSPRAVTAFIQFCGRRTLEIYVVHLVFFGILAVLLDVPGMGWFRWRAELALPGF